MSLLGVSGAHALLYSPKVQTAGGVSSQAVANTADSSTANESDQVAISSTGKLLSALPPLFSEEIEADGKITLDELRQFFQEKSADFQQEVNLRLAALGVDTSEPLELTTDASGQVRVAGDHPDKDKIEAMFEADPELSNQFRQISSTGSFIKAAESYLEFAADYAKDPEAAVAKYAYMFSALKPSYLVRLDQDGVSMVEAT